LVDELEVPYTGAVGLVTEEEELVAYPGMVTVLDEELGP